jgi:anti-sigma regulatory factor (Ser/Thr protein kinase)
MDTRLPPIPPAATRHEVVTWLPDDSAAVACARSLIAAVLDKWHLGKLGFTTQLIASELVTNAIRHAGTPALLRLAISQQLLVCEVSDGNDTVPELTSAGPDDEAGRGLLLVSEIAHRWGVRRTATGKTVWTEQRLPHSS